MMLPNVLFILRFCSFFILYHLYHNFCIYSNQKHLRVLQVLTGTYMGRSGRVRMVCCRLRQTGFLINGRPNACRGREEPYFSSPSS